MTPGARQEIQRILGLLQAQPLAEGESLLQEKATFTPPVKKTKVVKRVGGKGWIKCTRKPPDCGLLHDNMSILWGKFKDLVDELQSEMDRRAWEWKELQVNLNQQLEVLRNSKARFILQLNEAVANMNADREEMGEKDEERIELEHEYKVYMKACKKRIEWIMYQDICAFIGLRATILVTSTTCPPKKIVDCDWTPCVPTQENR